MFFCGRHGRPPRTPRHAAFFFPTGDTHNGLQTVPEQRSLSVVVFFCSRHDWPPWTPHAASLFFLRFKLEPPRDLLYLKGVQLSPKLRPISERALKCVYTGTGLARCVNRPQRDTRGFSSRRPCLPGTEETRNKVSNRYVGAHHKITIGCSTCCPSHQGMITFYFGSSLARYVNVLSARVERRITTMSAGESTPSSDRSMAPSI